MSIAKKHNRTWTAIGIAIAVLAIPGMIVALNIDSTYKYAWGENIGWINFGTSEGDVDVSTTDIDGYAWGENVGWISLTCDNTSSCGVVNYGVTRSGDELSGYAWGENVGWISFACENTLSCGTVDYGVEVDSITGDFSGYAWGENIGWIIFNCETTSSCIAVDYKVKTSATATPTPTTSSPPGVPPIMLPPPATATPTASVTPTASPTISVAPTVIPTTTPTTTPSVSPIVTPTTTPPPATPTTAPSPTTTVPPTERPPTEVIGRGLDVAARAIFGVIGAIVGGISDACDDSAVQTGACGATAVSSLIAVLGIVAMLLQQEVAAATFSMLQVVGLKKRARVWGTVYDTRTKRPVPLAKTELLDAVGRVLETRYADRDGRYGFLLSPSMLHAGEQVQISIRVAKPGFHFPSSLITSGTDYFVYDHVYQGGSISVRSDSALTFNIPMDSTASFRAGLSGFGRSMTGPLIDRILNLGFYAGLILVPLNLYLVPNTKNLIILIVFLAANLFRLLAHFRPYGTTIDARTGQRLAFALITLNEPDGGRVTFSVSDEFGRYILSAEKGHEYDLVAHTPANVSPQRETRERIRLKSGWMTQTIVVGKSELQAPPRPPAHAPPPLSPSISSAPQPSTGPSGLILSVLFFLFAIGFSAGRPRLPVGAMAEGVDEVYALMHPNVAAIAEVLRENTPLIEILSLIATATVLAGAILAGREALRNWLRGRQSQMHKTTRTIGTTAFVIGVIVVPMAYLLNPTTGRAVLGIAFLAVSGIWAHAKRKLIRI